MRAPDVLVLAGTIRTLTDDRPVVEALAVSDGRVTALGSRAAMVGLGGEATEVVDLGPDAVVLPGFVEAHAHPTLGVAFRGAGVVDARPGVQPTASGVMTAVREALATAPAGAPVAVVGWEDLLRPELPEPSRAWLDGLASDRPLAVLHNSMHAAWANTAAMRAIGLDRHTPDPPGSRFVRDADGEPTGRAEGLPATVTLAGAPLAVGADDLGPRLEAELAAYAAAGVTTVGELALDPDVAGLLAALTRDAAQLRVRSYRMSGRPAGEDTRPHDDALYRQVGVKLWADGSPWVGTFAASVPYLDNATTRRLGIAGTQGCCHHSVDEITAVCLAGLRAGEQVAVHAQGDAALDRVLDGIEAALAAATPEQRADHRTRLEHCCLMTPAQYRRAAALGVTCSLFLAHVRYWGDVLETLVGERGASWTAARSALDAGVRISLHNDVPVTPSEPLANLHAATTRRTARTGVVVGPHERIAPAEALRAVTVDAAWQLRSEHEVGSLGLGRFADLVVLSADPLAVEPDALDRIRVEETWLGGRRVHRRTDP